MAQKTNLNISPYYDDYDKSDQFYKVLFKPGFPVQARELSTLQSILQNQVESFGTHIFKDGSMVIPGGIAYDQEYYSLKIEEEHLGTPVTLYLNELIGLRLKGETTGFLEAGDDNSTNGLIEGENLIVEETFSYGNTIINAGQSVLNLVESEDAFNVGSAVGISEGVYFIRGNFVQVNSEKIVLDPYDNLPSYRVGLSIDEQLISAKDDDSLYDNARGFSNYAAPGADRLKIKTTLTKKALTDFNDTNFVELIRLDEGTIKLTADKTDYNLIKDYFAKRTYEESGNYSLNQFEVDVFNSLNDGISGDGVYRSNEIMNLSHLNLLMSLNQEINK